MSFKERNIQGFKLGMKKGIEYFFGLGSVLYYVSQGLDLHAGGRTKGVVGKTAQRSPTTMGRYLVAKRKCREDTGSCCPRICSSSSALCVRDG